MLNRDVKYFMYFLYLKTKHIWPHIVICCHVNYSKNILRKIDPYFHFNVCTKQQQGRTYMVTRKDIHGYKEGHIWLQGRTYMVTRKDIHGYKEGHTWLQGRTYMVTMKDIHGYKEGHTWLQGRTYMVTRKGGVLRISLPSFM